MSYNRFGRSGTLTVEEVNNSQKTSTKSSSSPGISSILHVDNSTLMFIGGISGGLQVTMINQTLHISNNFFSLGDLFIKGIIGIHKHINNEV